MKLDERVARKDKIILGLEQKIRSQEATIQNLVVGSERKPRTRRCSSSSQTKEKLQVSICTEVKM